MSSIRRMKQLTLCVVLCFFIANSATPQNVELPNTPPYSFPSMELSRGDGIDTLGYLQVGATYRLLYSWHDTSKEVVIKGKMRNVIGDPWIAFEKKETVAFHMTAVAPHHATHSLYIVGTNSNGKTFAERWRIEQVSADSTVSIQKTTVIAPTAALTHIRACAITPNECALLVQKHESGAVRRIDLSTGQVTTIVDASAQPNIASYDMLDWAKHTDLRDAYIMRKGRNGQDVFVLSRISYLVIWDHDGDGVPESSEELTLEQFIASGYMEETNWIRPFEWWTG